MTGVARLGDKCVGICKAHKNRQFNGTIISASSNITSNGVGVATLGDKVRADCGHEGVIISASTTSTAGGVGVARLGDKFDGVFVGQIVAASDNVTTM